MDRAKLRQDVWTQRKSAHARIEESDVSMKRKYDTKCWTAKHQNARVLGITQDMGYPASMRPG